MKFMWIEKQTWYSIFFQKRKKKCRRKSQKNIVYKIEWNHNMTKATLLLSGSLLWLTFFLFIAEHLTFSIFYILFDWCHVFAVSLTHKKSFFFSSFVLALVCIFFCFYVLFWISGSSLCFFPAFSPITLLHIIIPVAYLCVYIQRSTNLRRENPLKPILFRSVLSSSFLLCSVLFNVVVFLYCVKTKRNWFQWIFIRDL